MPNLRTYIWQGFHVQRYSKRRNITLHIHVDPASSVHRHIHDQFNLSNVLSEGHLFDQQHGTGLERCQRNRFSFRSCRRTTSNQHCQLWNWSDLGQSIHMHCHNFWRHRALHLHLDSACRMHGNFNNSDDIGNVLTEGNLLYQQCSQGQ